MDTRNAPSYQCELCQYESHKLPNLARHTETKHKDLCMKSDFAIQLYRYKCTNCEFDSECQEEMREHLMNGHMCSPNKQTKNRPKEKHIVFICQVCEMTFTREIFLNNHVLVHIKDEEFKCTDCGYIGVTERGLKIHLNRHSENMPFNCTKCYYKCKNEQSMELHVLSHTEIRPFSCPHCTFSGKSRSALTKHMVYHAEKKFLCDFCDHRASTIYLLTRHLRTHTGEKPFKCSYCDFKAASTDGVNRHMPIHTGVKPFLCNLCGYRCAHQGNYEKHIRKHTGDKRYKCPLCSYRSTVAFCIKRHLKNKHDDVTSKVVRMPSLEYKLDAVEVAPDNPDLTMDDLYDPEGAESPDLNDNSKDPLTNAVDGLDLDSDDDSSSMVYVENIETNTSDQLIDSLVTMATINTQDNFDGIVPNDKITEPKEKNIQTRTVLTSNKVKREYKRRQVNDEVKRVTEKLYERKFEDKALNDSGQLDFMIHIDDYEQNIHNTRGWKRKMEAAKLVDESLEQVEQDKPEDLPSEIESAVDSSALSTTVDEKITEIHSAYLDQSWGFVNVPEMNVTQEVDVKIDAEETILLDGPEIVLDKSIIQSTDLEREFRKALKQQQKSAEIQNLELSNKINNGVERAFNVDTQVKDAEFDNFTQNTDDIPTINIDINKDETEITKLNDNTNRHQSIQSRPETVYSTIDESQLHDIDHGVQITINEIDIKDDEELQKCEQIVDDVTGLIYGDIKTEQSVKEESIKEEENEEYQVIFYMNGDELVEANLSELGIELDENGEIIADDDVEQFLEDEHQENAPMEGEVVKNEPMEGQTEVLEVEDESVKNELIEVEHTKTDFELYTDNPEIKCVVEDEDDVEVEKSDLSEFLTDIPFTMSTRSQTKSHKSPSDKSENSPHKQTTNKKSNKSTISNKVNPNDPDSEPSEIKSPKTKKIDDNEKDKENTEIPELELEIQGIKSPKNTRDDLNNDETKENADEQNYELEEIIIENIIALDLEPPKKRQPKYLDYELCKSLKTVSGIYACNECDYTTPKLATMMRHKRKHSGYKPHSCPFPNCGFTTTATDNLKRHSLKHTGVREFRCHICTFSASRQSNLKAHILIHSKDRPFKCDQCDYRGISANSVHRHKVKHLSIKPWLCIECGFQCRQENMLKRHMKTHTGERPFECDMCDYAAACSDTLAKHKYTHTGEKFFFCSQCPYKSANSGNLKKHAMKHTGERPYSCSLCRYRCTNTSTLKRHMQRHDRVRKPREFPCDECGKMFARLSKLKRHQVGVRNTCKATVFKCRDCERMFSRHTELIRHQLGEHGNTEMCPKRDVPIIQGTMDAVTVHEAGSNRAPHAVTVHEAGSNRAPLVIQYFTGSKTVQNTIDLSHAIQNQQALPVNSVLSVNSGVATEIAYVNKYDGPQYFTGVNSVLQNTTINTVGQPVNNVQNTTINTVGLPVNTVKNTPHNTLGLSVNNVHNTTFNTVGLPIQNTTLNNNTVGLIAPNPALNTVHLPVPNQHNTSPVFEAHSANELYIVEDETHVSSVPHGFYVYKMANQMDDDGKQSVAVQT